MTFPYTTGFDTGNDLWTVYDGNNDGVIWGFDSSSSLGNIAYFPADALASNDWLISPAISMPKGRSRLSFYYSGGTRLTQHLRVLMGTEPSVDKMTEVLFDEDVKNNGWLNGYHVIDLDESGLRYFAFQTTGKSDQIIIDNIKIDQAEDLCIGSVDFKEKSGFAKTTSKVSLSYINHGVTPQKNITLRYWLNTADDPYAPTKAPYAEETVADEVQPGETVTYTFEKEADDQGGRGSAERPHRRNNIARKLGYALAALHAGLRGVYNSTEAVDLHTGGYLKMACGQQRGWRLSRLEELVPHRQGGRGQGRLGVLRAVAAGEGHLRHCFLLPHNKEL